MGYDLTKLDVLVVEDSASMRVLIRRLLSAFEIQRIREAVDGEDGLAQIRDVMPDVVITDFAMSPMDGIAFTRKVRLAPDTPNPYLPIVMVTGYTERRRIFQARDAGVTEIVAKPLSTLVLYNRFVAVIERPRPFVRTDGFFGPDRRRRQVPYEGEDRRGRPKGDTIEVDFG